MHPAFKSLVIMFFYFQYTTAHVNHCSIFYRSLKDVKDEKNDESSDDENARESDEAEKATSETSKLKPETDKNEGESVSQEPKKSNENLSLSSKKRKKLSARQRRRKREREQLELNKVAQKGAWIKKQTNESFQRLARIEPSALKAYGLKPKRVLRQAKHDFVNKKKKNKN